MGPRARGHVSSDSVRGWPKMPLMHYTITSMGFLPTVVVAHTHVLNTLFPW